MGIREIRDRPRRAGADRLNPACSFRCCGPRSTRPDSPRPTGESATSPCSPRDRRIRKALPVTPAWEKIDRPDGPQLRTGAARIPAGDIADRAVGRRRRGAAQPMTAIDPTARAGIAKGRSCRADGALGRSLVRRAEPGRGRGVHAVSARILAVHELSPSGTCSDRRSSWA